MQIWELVTFINKPHRAPIVILSQERKARNVVLGLDITRLHADDGMEKLYKKLDTLFLESFEQYRRQNNMSIDDYLINFDDHVTKLKDHNMQLPEPVFAYRALKCANLTPENEQQVKATIGKLTLSTMSKQL